MMRCKKLATLGVALLIFLVVPIQGGWKRQEVRQMNGQEAQIKLPARLQVVTASWNRVVAVPSIVYMPEKDRLLMLVSCDYPHQAMVLSSDDHGATWGPPRYVHTDAAGKPDTGMGTGLTYLGQGRLLFDSRNDKGAWVWFSSDYGKNWRESAPFPPASDGSALFRWDPPLLDKNEKTGKIERLLAGVYMMDEKRVPSAAIRVSTDEAQTWGDVIHIPEWVGANEVAFARAKNGDIVAACRTDWSNRFRKTHFDHYEGLGVSISKDNGKSWSKIQKLYDWGRHHQSMVVLPSRDIVLTYVVRKGYPDTDDGYPQFGVEAVVSPDHGKTWDLDHRYILNRWTGIRKGPNAWYASSQATSTVLLPDGSLLTAYGTGYRSTDPAGKIRPGPRDVGLIRWNVSTGTVNSDRTISNAPADSDLRNTFNPDPSRKNIELYCPAQPSKKNVAVVAKGARITASANDGTPSHLFRNPYYQPVLTLQSIPAWVEISWAYEKRIDEIHIQPGAPELFNQPRTECVPLDYRILYRQEDEWVDLMPPVTNAKRYQESYAISKSYQHQDEAFEYVHKFAPVSVNAIRLSITRSSDAGKRAGSSQRIVVPENKRETGLRLIEVFEVQAN